MQTKDLNIFVCDSVVCYDCRALPVRQLFADACEVTIKRFDIIDILYQAISGFILLINGPPRGKQISSFLCTFLCPFQSFFSIGKLSWR